MKIYVDADACPVKSQVYKVAERHELEVILVANAWMRVPDEPWIRLEVVGAGEDVADDWIAEHVEVDDLVITADIPLASRCLQRGGWVVGPSGKRFTEDNIGDAVATRDLLTGLRSAGEMTGGPPPRQARDSSRFLQELETTIQAVLREQRRRALFQRPATPDSAP